MVPEKEADQSSQWKGRLKKYKDKKLRWNRGQGTRRKGRLPTEGGPAWEPYKGMRLIPETRESTRWEGSVRGDRILLEQLQETGGGLGIGTPEGGTTQDGGLRLAGVNHSLSFDWSPPSRPRPHELTTPRWVKNIAKAIAEEGRSPLIITTDASSKPIAGRCSSLWEPLAERKAAQGAMMLFDSEIYKEGGQGPIATIVVTGFPPEMKALPGTLELVLQVGGHQLAKELSIPRIEMDCKGILTQSQKELKRGYQ